MAGEERAAPVRDDAAACETWDFTYDEGGGERVDRLTPVETPINIVYAPMPFAVMMASPRDLIDFAYGFSFTEGVVDTLDDIRSVEVEEAEGGLRLVVTLASEKLQRHLARARNIAGRTGCGLCGIDDLKAMPKAPARGKDSDGALARIARGAISRAVNDVVGWQDLNRRTKAVHAAAWCARDGAIEIVREDVGRHNALDKLIGAMMRARRPAADGFLLITSRASFEMIEKAAFLGARVVVALSAPTSLAVERARLHGMTLIGAAKPTLATAFAGFDAIDRGESA